jgi:hypothetical protein
MANTWRADITDPHSGTHRARLEAAWLAADVGEIVGVSLNASGRVVKGAGNTGVIGVLCMSQVRPAGHPVDIIKIGELVGGTQIAGGAAVAGTSYSITAAGVIAATAAGVPGNLGYTTEVDRFVVDFRTP